MGGIGGQGGIKMASTSTPSVNEGLILVHTIKVKPIIKAKISGRMASIGISDVVSCDRFRILRENPSEEVLDYDYYE